MMKDLTVFNFNAKQLTAIAGKDGEPWFIAKDVCNHLDIVSSRQAVGSLDDDEKLLHTLYTAGQNRDTWIINESGLYSLVMRSNKPESKLFKKWVTSEVLPIIRKTGSYSSSAMIVLPTDYSSALRALADEVEKKQEALKLVESKNFIIEKKDELIVATNQAQVSAGEVLVRHFVKGNDDIKLGEKGFYDWMRHQGYVSPTNEPYQQYKNAGYFTFKPSDEKINGSHRYTTRITPKGKVWLAAKYIAFLKEEGLDNGKSNAA